MLKLYWRLYINSSTEKSSQKIVELFTKKINILLVKKIFKIYKKSNKSGVMVNLEFVHNNKSYSEFIIEIIGISQKLGNGWILLGNILEDPSAVLDKNSFGNISVSGVEWAEWSIDTR